MRLGVEGEWTDELMRTPESERTSLVSRLRRYAHVEIKAAVIADTHGECIYWESMIGHVAPGDIEHIKPKSKYHEESYVWENLAFVCNECNRRKHNTYDEDLIPINSYEEDPSDFLSAYGAYIFANLGSVRGQMMVLLVELDRSKLMERRGGKIRGLEA